ncbi:broad-complex core protein isoforms 1/2/3/4/5-like isoform X3 [Macrobrachium rosenbergii]|uniref:broad-complex core protein isoforms 1/2/3/4/5-like isoform X3 n=1 Tax=Macrobrachium rosenbergii TaxID=79674 RepID=UPI0034D78786
MAFGLGGPGAREPWDGRIMAEQQFCLRWNNFQANIVSSFETLLDREEFVDVTLTAEGKSVKAHRVLLSACSPYFRDLFRDLPAHQHPVIVLRDTSFTELKSLLSFIYHGEVNVSQERLGLLLKTAEALRIKGLAQDKKTSDNEQFGSLTNSPEKEPEEGLDRGEHRGGGSGSPAQSLAFPGIGGSVLAPANPLVPLEPPSHKPHLLHSPPAKRRKPIPSPLGAPAGPTPPTRENNVSQAPPVTSSSHEEDTSARVINLTMGATNSSGSPSPRIIPKAELSSPRLLPKNELNDEEEGPGRGCIGGGSSSGGGGGGSVGGAESSDHEGEELPEEDCKVPPDLHGLPHLSAAVQNFVPYVAAAAAAAGSSQLETFPGPSGVLPPASQAGWRGGHSESSDTSAQGGHPVFNELLCGDGGYGGKKAVPTPCPVCSKVLSNAYNMRVHLETHQNIAYKCIICGIITRTRDTMRKHLSNVHKLRNVELKNSFKKITGKQQQQPPQQSGTADTTTPSTTVPTTTPTKTTTASKTTPCDLKLSGIASPLVEADTAHASVSSLDNLGALNLAKGNNLASIVNKLTQKQ